MTCWWRIQTQHLTVKEVHARINDFLSIFTQIKKKVLLQCFFLYLYSFVLHLTTVLIGFIKYIYSVPLPAFHWHMSDQYCDILSLSFLLVTWLWKLYTKSFFSLFSLFFSVDGHVLMKEGNCQRSLFILSLRLRPLHSIVALLYAALALLQTLTYEEGADA